jgi:hypothetical protein
MVQQKADPYSALMAAFGFGSSAQQNVEEAQLCRKVEGTCILKCGGGTVM